MRSFFAICFAAVGLLLATAVTHAQQLALDVTSDTQVFAPGVFHNIGWQFTVSSPVSVNGLGIFDVNPAGLGEEHQVGLWTDSGTLLAQTTITSGSTFISSASNAGDWLFGDIAAVVLVPGTYVTGGFYATSADSVMANASITTVPQISFLASRASMEGAFAMPGVYGLVEPGVFGANLRVTVPEPGTLAMLGLGIAFFFRRSKKA